MNELGGPAPGEGDQPDWPDTLVIPDDPSGLAADALALRRERQAARRRARWHRLTGGDRFRAYGVSVPVVVVALLVVAGFGALLVLLGPRTRPSTSPTPRAADPTAEPGRPGGRLPSVSLREPDGATIDASTLTAPAALLLVPTACNCTATVDVVAGLALRAGLRVYVVEPNGAGASGIDAAGDERVVGYSDASRRLLGTYGATGDELTLLLVDHTGAVRTVTTGVSTASAPTTLADVPD